MNFKSLAVLAFLSLPMLSQAQEGFKGERFIEVTGMAQTEIEPNEIFTHIRLREFEENKQKTTLEKLEKDFMKALKDAGIDRQRLELADIGTRLDTFRKKDRDSFREKTYQLKLTSGTELSKFLEAMQSVKIDHIDIVRLHHTDYEKIKTDLKMKALQSARSKAEALLKSIGANIGKPLVVRDWEVEPYQPMAEMKSARMQSMDAMGMAEPEPIGFRKIKLQAQIMAQFSIE